MTISYIDISIYFNLYHYLQQFYQTNIDTIILLIYINTIFICSLTQSYYRAKMKHSLPYTHFVYYHPIGPPRIPHLHIIPYINYRSQRPRSLYTLLNLGSTSMTTYLAFLLHHISTLLDIAALYWIYLHLRIYWFLSIYTILCICTKSTQPLYIVIYSTVIFNYNYSLIIYHL